MKLAILVGLAAIATACTQIKKPPPALADASLSGLSSPQTTLPPVAAASISISAEELDGNETGKFYLPSVALERPPPTYPPWLFQHRIRGEVLIVFVIDNHGHVVEPRIVNATDSRLASAVLAVIRSWHYRPATDGTRPLYSRVRVKVIFDVNEGPNQSPHPALANERG